MKLFEDTIVADRASKTVGIFLYVKSTLYSLLSAYGGVNSTRQFDDATIVLLPYLNDGIEMVEIYPKEPRPSKVEVSEAVEIYPNSPIPSTVLRKLLDVTRPSIIVLIGLAPA